MKNDAHGHQDKYPEVSLIYDWIITLEWVHGTPQKVKIILEFDNYNWTKNKYILL